MSLSQVFIAIAGASVFCSIVSAMIIASELQKRGVKVNYLLIRVLIIKYVSQYARVTREETGKPGPWYYCYIFSLLIALSSALLAFALR